MDLRGQLVVLRRWYRLILVGIAVAAATAFAASMLLPKIYEVQSTLIVGQSLTAVNPDSNQLLVSQRLSETYAELALNRPLLERVASSLSIPDSPEELGQRVSAEAHKDSTLLTITAQDESPIRAAAIANKVADELIALSPTVQARRFESESNLDKNLAATQAQIDQAQEALDALVALTKRTAAEEARLQSLEGRIASLRATYAALLTYASNSSANLLSVIAPAVPPTEPASPRVPLNTALGGLAGLVLMVGFVFLREYLDDTLKTPEDVEAQTALPTLGTIARIRSDPGASPMYRLVTLLYPRSAASEAFRALRTNVEFASVDAPISSLLVTSSVQAEGKTTVASNLAVAFAQAGRRTLLVDADMRDPGVHGIFSLPNAYGLTSLLRSDQRALEEALQSTDQANLKILTSGPIPPNPAELLGSQRMRAIVESLMRTADVVIFDSPPLRAVTDAAVLAPIVDGTLLVVDASRTRRADVRLGREALVRVGARVIGATLNRVPASGATEYYGYGQAMSPRDAADVPSTASRGVQPESGPRQV